MASNYAFKRTARRGFHVSWQLVAPLPLNAALACMSCDSRAALLFALAAAAAAIPVAFFAASVTPPGDPFKPFVPPILPPVAGGIAATYVVGRGMRFSWPQAGVRAGFTSLMVCALLQSVGYYFWQGPLQATLSLVLTIWWAAVLFGWYAALLGAGIGWLVGKACRAAS